MNRKKIMTLIIGAFIALNMQTITTFASDFQTTHNLNVRTGPSTSHKIVTTLPKGTIVDSLSIADGWHKISYNNKDGYLSADYLKAIESAQPAPAPENPSTEVKQVKIMTSLHMRSGAGTNHSSVLILPKNAVADFIQKEANGWYKISYKGKVGYSSGKYISEILSPTSPPPSTPAPTPSPTPSPDPSVPVEASGKGKVSASLNMREKAGVGSRVILVLPKNAIVVIKGKDAQTGWYQVEYQGKVGFASNKYVTVVEDTLPGTSTPTPTPPTPTPTPEPAPVPTPTPEAPTVIEEDIKMYEARTGNYGVNLREAPSMNGKVLTTVPAKTKMVYLGTDKGTGWLKVEYQGKVGYMSSEYASKDVILGVRVLEIAKTMLDKPYMWGAEGPVDFDRDGDVRDGYDCSGLFQWAYWKAGYTIPRTTYTQYTKGQKIERENVQVGDLIYFKTGTGANPVDHVAMYAGDEKMLHASGSAGKVVITDIYWDKMVVVRRH